MNDANEVKANPNPVVIGKTTARELTAATAPSFSFPIGYYELHPDISINFQLNRFYGWVGDDSMLTEMREATAGVAGVCLLYTSVADLNPATLGGSLTPKELK